MTVPDKKEFWLKLNAYHFNHIASPKIWNHLAELFGGEDASTKAFADKIRRKHDWKTGFALKAIHEYKKFIYLGVISNFNVTPSKIIDTVWHEHLLFTKAYRLFCEEIIGFNFDHHPELISFDEQTEVYAEQYVKTLLLYRREFGVDAPVDIWSVPKFNASQIASLQAFYPQKRKEMIANGTDTDYSGYDQDLPLVSYFDSDQFAEFGGGDFGGAGAGGDFSDSSESSDSGDSSCSSGCSSGCGGGGD